MNQKKSKIKFALAPLPYGKSALAPHISEKTVETHYGKHHAHYVQKLNELLEVHLDYYGHSLEEIILKAKEGELYNNAAQVWNHNFYWQNLSPKGGGRPGLGLAKAIERRYGSFESFQKEFNENALELFGSGWLWLVQGKDGQLDMVKTANAHNPLGTDLSPLMVCDLWEHAYYIDYLNERESYVEGFWNVINWDFVNLKLNMASNERSSV